MKCDCEDFKKTMRILNDLVAESTLIRGRGEYQGVIMRYCAWCGKKLKEEEDECTE